MSPELLIKLKDLVFSPRNPYLSLDNLLQPYLDLMAECERETIGRCAQLIERDWVGCEQIAADIRALD